MGKLRKFGRLTDTMIRQGPINLISNGNFVDANGWTPAGSTLATADNKATITGSGTTRYPQIYQSIPGSTGNKIFVKAKLKVTNSVAQAISIAGSGTAITFQANPTQDVVYTLSGIRTMTGVSAENFSIFATYPDNATAGGKILEVQEVFAVNLTTLFGAGNEPTVPQCNQLFPIWFDGLRPSSKSKFLG